MIKNNNNNPPYVRKKISPTLFAFSAIALLLLASSPLLLLSNPILLQPVQAQTTTMTFNTQSAGGSMQCCPENVQATLTFDAQGIPSSSDFRSAKITNGTFQLNFPSSGGQKYDGSILSGQYKTIGMVESLDMVGQMAQNPGYNYTISTQCSTSDDNDSEIDLDINNRLGDLTGTFSGVVECNPSQGEGHATQTYSSMTGSSEDGDSNSKDGDGDGIPDSSDNCTHNSNPRCFKEGDATTTITQSSSSSMAGNQTR
jgi:hypothetical protein